MDAAKRKLQLRRTELLEELLVVDQHLLALEKEEKNSSGPKKRLLPEETQAFASNEKVKVGASPPTKITKNNEERKKRILKERTFQDGEKVSLDDKEWEVLQAVHHNVWVYDLLRSTPRQVDFASLRKCKGTGEVQELDEVVYDHKEFQYHAKLIKIYRADQTFYCDIRIIKRSVEEDRISPIWKANKA
jgi:hypothetical protein